MSEYQRTIENLKEKPKTWLITGVAGFIGSNLLEQLLTMNQKVVGLDNFSTGSIANLEEVKKVVHPTQWRNFKFLEGDICDVDTCDRACTDIDLVLHQAALGSVPRSISDPITTNINNINGFVNILTAAKNASVKRFVFASSSSVYGDYAKLPKTEDKIGRPLSPYALTKLSNELYADVYNRTYGIETVGLRYFNVFGKRQNPDGPYAAVIPKWISAVILGEEVFINGDGKSSRDFCHIQNVIQANVLAATTINPEAINRTYNIALGDRTTLQDLYFKINAILSKRMDNMPDGKLTYREFRPGDIRHSHADITIAIKLLGYKPEYQIDEGLDQAIAWYLSRKY